MISSEELIPGDVVKIVTGPENKQCESIDKRDNSQILREMVPMSRFLPPAFFKTSNDDSNQNSFK